MFFSPLKYEEPMFRPPSEANSLIFQVSIGCSWNKCAFCEMYTSKKFSIRKEDEMLEEIRNAALVYPDVRKIFLADGNAMVLSTDKLLRILDAINGAFNRIVRISAYAGSRDLQNKTAGDLIRLKEAGLKLLYVGIETGNDDLLQRINKGETADSVSENLLKAKEAGIKLSVMILSGLGGQKYSEVHAADSAVIVSKIVPDYLSTLVLSFPFGVDHYKTRFDGDFIEMKQVELLTELHQFIHATSFDNVVFRSDHASNYLALKGILGRDKGKMLKQLEYAINNPDGSNLREDWQRGL